MSERIKGRIAVVTGAARGLGQAFALRLAREGADLVLIDQAKSAETEALVAQAGRKAASFECDLADGAAVQRTAKRVISEFGAPDILLNNAGIYPFQPLEQISLEEWRTVFAVNLDSAFLLSQAFVPKMKERRWGRIINISSNTCWTLAPNFCHYITSKLAIVGLTRALASELGSFGITVNAIAPSLTRTPGTEATPAREIYDSWHKGQAIPRLEVPEDLVGTVAFLASDDAAFITAQTLMVDGGMVRV